MYSSFTDGLVDRVAVAFFDELEKIASSAEEVPLDDVQQEKNRGIRPHSSQSSASDSPFADRIRRHAGDALAGAAGFGVGYGSAYAAGRMFGDRKPGIHKSRMFPVATGALGLAGGIAAKHLAERRQQYVEGHHK